MRHLFKMCTEIPLNFRQLFRISVGLSLLWAWVQFGARCGHAQTSLNVANFGAVGDERQVWVRTVAKSTIVSFTNSLSSADIGKTVMLFGVGDLNVGNNVKGLYVTNAQDLIAVIGNVVNETNAVISGDIPQVTSNGVYCIYGKNNSDSFQAAVNAAQGTNTIINIPAGNFLMIPDCQYTNFNNPIYFAVFLCQGIILNKGGLHFEGAGPGKTILVADGAFKNQGGFCLRGGIFNCIGPVTNNYPLIWEGVTFDGGMPIADTGNEGTQPANPIDGQGWDGSSYAGLDSGIQPLHLFKEFNNCEFRHFRGEMIKGITGSAENQTILVTNCFAWDGNATVFNYNFAHTITGCTFSNMYQVEEFYLKYPTNYPSYFVNNVTTNVWHNVISLNGGTLTNEPYIISNNVFSCENSGNAIATCPASSVLIVSNQFIEEPGASTIAIDIGEAGAQPGSPDACNTNILISGNTFINGFYTYFMAGGTGPTDPNSAQNIIITGNNIINANGPRPFYVNYGWASGIQIASNNFNGNQLHAQQSDTGPYAFIATNNNYWAYQLCDGGAGTNVNISYGGGPMELLTYHYSTNVTFELSDADSNSIPAGAQLVVTNGNWSNANIPIWLNSARTLGPIIIPWGKVMVFDWTNGRWVPEINVGNPAPSVSAITANPAGVSTNGGVLMFNPGPLQLSAQAFSGANDSLTWQWTEVVNGGAASVYSQGSGLNPSMSFTNTPAMIGTTNVWTLTVKDPNNGLSVQMQVVVEVVAPVSSPINEIPIPGQTLNVTNYGAIGDAVQLYVNTSSNSVLVTTTNVLPTSCVGDAIEIFGQGQSTYGTNSYGTVGYGNQDLIANITRVIRGTNVYISIPSQKSTAGAFATFGHENSANIQSAMAAVTNANAAIYFPSGNYLVLARSTSPGYGNFGIGLNRGGLAFTGDGPGNTRLISQGAWTLQGGSAWRGFLFEENPPVTNNLPFIIENMTVDGGVQQGNTSLHGYPANPVDGQGWDLTHDAFLVANSAPDVAFNQMIWTNVVFQHWRGDMARTLDQGVNANLLVQNCSFLDGNATAFNLDSSICFSNCLFDNLFQVAEYSLAYTTNTCYFENNLCTNITGNTLEIVGGTGGNPGFVVCNNSFYLAGNGLNGIETGPADNLTVSNNTFVCQDYANVVNLGVAGYQGTFDNSNILITANTVINPATFLEISGGSSATDPRRSESVIASGNVLENPDFGVTLFLDGGWSTNVVLSGNNCSQFNNLQNSVLVQSAAGGVPYAEIGLDNQYFTQVQSPVAATNILSYGNGSRYYANNSAPGSAWVIQNSDSGEIPSGAQVYFVNLNSFSIPFYLNSVNGGQTMIANGGSVTAAWQNNQWVLQGTNSSGNTTLAVSAISVSVPNAETNSTVYAVQPGSLQLSASAAGPAGDPIAWQWLVGVNGGPLASYSSGSGSNPALGLTYSTAQEGNTNLWVLQVTDTKSGVSAQTNLNLFVMLPSPQGMHFSFSVAGQ